MIYQANQVLQAIISILNVRIWCCLLPQSWIHNDGCTMWLLLNILLQHTIQCTFEWLDCKRLMLMWSTSQICRLKQLSFQFIYKLTQSYLTTYRLIGCDSFLVLVSNIQYSSWLKIVAATRRKTKVYVAVLLHITLYKFNLSMLHTRI